MKAILMSIKPKYVADILNGEKTIEIRKRFPKDYVGWVYIYCTSHKNYRESLYELETYKKKRKFDVDYYIPSDPDFIFNGKVIARFWCDKVGTHRPFFHWCIEKETCLTRDDVLDYLDSKDKSVGNTKRQGKVYAIHITKLEIFDKPKEISEFNHYITRRDTVKGIIYDYEELTRAPQSWCYIEI